MSDSAHLDSGQHRPVNTRATRIPQPNTRFRQRSLGTGFGGNPGLNTPFKPRFQHRKAKVWPILPVPLQSSCSSLPKSRHLLATGAAERKGLALDANLGNGAATRVWDGPSKLLLSPTH